MSEDKLQALLQSAGLREGELERLRMQVVACGVVAMADTPESAKSAREMHPDYWSASCGDVARRVDECIDLRQQLAALAAERDAAVSDRDTNARKSAEQFVTLGKDFAAVRARAEAAEGEVRRLREVVDQAAAVIGAMPHTRFNPFGWSEECTVCRCQGTHADGCILHEWNESQVAVLASAGLENGKDIHISYGPPTGGTQEKPNA